MSARAQSQTFLHWLLITPFLLLLGSPGILAQQPFVTDDADVTQKHHFHFEFSNEFDVLQRSALPTLRQNTAVFEVDYGLLNGLEVGIETPWLSLFNSRDTTPLRLSGIGDTNLSLKYNFLTAEENSHRPAMALALNLEFPTGNAERQLGSGLKDFYMNGILQKSVTKRTKLRLNGGILFSGNQTTGEIGIKTRGTVFSGGASVVKQFTPRLDLGFEVTGAVTRDFQLGKGQLQTLIGGNYTLNDHLTFDFGAVAGKYAASPRGGIQLGISADW